MSVKYEFSELINFEHLLVRCSRKLIFVITAVQRITADNPLLKALKELLALKVIIENLNFVRLKVLWISISLVHLNVFLCDFELRVAIGRIVHQVSEIVLEVESHNLLQLCIEGVEIKVLVSWLDLGENGDHRLGNFDRASLERPHQYL